MCVRSVKSLYYYELCYIILNISLFLIRLATTRVEVVNRGQK